MKKTNSFKGILVPLVTPYYQGSFDAFSMKKLIQYVEPYINGFVPCLSSGEGEKLTKEDWIQVIKTVRKHTKKPVIAGIKKNTISEILEYASIAKKLRCDAIIIPVVHIHQKASIKHIAHIMRHSPLPVVIYNTKLHCISAKSFLYLSKLNNFIGIKDSSGNQKFFNTICNLKKKYNLSISILQGLEHQLIDSSHSDGFLISLANLEPELCKSILQRNEKSRSKLKKIFYRYNFGGQWFVTLKALLLSRTIIRSAEEVVLAFKP